MGKQQQHKEGSPRRVLKMGGEATFVSKGRVHSSVLLRGDSLSASIIA
jgi:hypothetical protein